MFWTPDTVLEMHTKRNSVIESLDKPDRKKFNDDVTMQSGRSSAGYALLIGIEDYKDTGLTSLTGSGNDIDLIQGVLKKRFEFDDKNIMVLKNKKASHSAIEKAFSDLAARVNPGAPVYIHYSGHGSFTPNLHQHESEKNDQTWVSYASRRSDKKDKDNYDILDDEINE